MKKISELPDKTESIRLISHLINCQYKWMERIQQFHADNERSWWEPIYEFDKLEGEWDKSIKPWLDYFSAGSNIDLDQDIAFVREDGEKWAVAVRDIALQLNYHSFHHRAQIQTIIRQQGFVPDTLDYIRTKYRKLEVKC